jgi:hypothetical protein
MTCPTVLVSVFNNAADADTSTVSATVPTASVKSTRAVMFTSNCKPVRVWGEKPVAEAVTSYEPGTRNGTE